MPLFMYQCSYTPESLAAQIKDPKDRLEVVKPAIEAIGGRLLAGGYPFGESDILAIYEAPSDTAAAAIALAFAAGGALRSGKTTKLLSGAEWVEALRATGTVSPQYKPAR
ncbi:MAG TPA: GYD domain-containing protein [Chloroflexota bacterium]|nr:GYD domain-containing protein [Chloroflexota bacterium]